MTSWHFRDRHLFWLLLQRVTFYCLLFFLRRKCPDYCASLEKSLHRGFPVTRGVGVAVVSRPKLPGNLHPAARGSSAVPLLHCTCAKNTWGYMEPCRSGKKLTPSVESDQLAACQVQPSRTSCEIMVWCALKAFSHCGRLGQAQSGDGCDATVEIPQPVECPEYRQLGAPDSGVFITSPRVVSGSLGQRAELPLKVSTCGLSQYSRRLHASAGSLYRHR